MDRFIHELRHRRLSLLDDGIDVFPSPEAGEQSAAHDLNHLKDLAKDQPCGVLRSSAMPRKVAVRGSSNASFKGVHRGRGLEKRSGSFLARPQIISCFIDYFVVFVTVAGVYFGYRLVSHSSVSTALLGPGTLPADSSAHNNNASGGDALGSDASGGSVWELLADLNWPELVLVGSMGLVGISVLYFVYKSLHRLFGISSLGERFARSRSA